MSNSMYLKSVAVSSTVMLICFLLQGCSRAKHYQSHHDCESLYLVLHQQVKAGDSKAAVEQLLGIGKIPSPADKEKLLSAIKKGTQKLPQAYPDGVEDIDEFVGYGCGPESVNCGGEIFYLQFRDGKLINCLQDLQMSTR